MIHLMNWTLPVLLVALNAVNVWFALQPGSNLIVSTGSVAAITCCAWWAGMSYGKVRQAKESLYRDREM